MKLLFDNRIELDDADLERIHQAILFFATSVSIRAGASWSGLQPEKANRRIAELREIGAIEVWAHEYEVTDGGYLVENHRRATYPGIINHILTVEDLASASEDVDHVLRLNREAIYELQIGPTTLREGVAEIVQHRRTLLGMRLSDSLLLDGLALLNNPPATPTHDLETLVDNDVMFQEAIRLVVSRCGFGNLTGLPLESIVECRKHLPDFRDYVGGLIEQTSPQPQPDVIANRIMAAYQDLLHESEHGTIRDGVKSFSKEALWDVIGTLLPPTLLIKYFGKAFSFGKKRKDFKPFLLLASVHAHSKNKEANT